ncbi:(2E,6E)-farnesyl diphosphate synthase [Thaumasiovibrio sp. DFM-14]|uniref:(2E,6E)-farnesyl diphosphate synthase n=1 Tax=Thaumasiovibrio sp. DFM-14 TaxID=3384792 RepID=UPI0039A28697
MTESISLNTILSDYQQRNNQQLLYWLEQLPDQNGSLVQAMRHGALLGGKRARPFLVYSVGEMFGTAKEDLDAAAAAIECVHAYSLIHDDLPAMDNDDLRRGQPTCHRAFDEATAILAGDALQTLAFDILATGRMRQNAKRIEMIAALAKASGAAGMCLGQSLDLQAEDQQVALTHLERIHRHKTGALIRCAVKLGALSSGDVSTQTLEQLDIFADKIGLAFQVQDDILDIIGDTETLGKPQGSDLEAHKSTYPALLGLGAATDKALRLHQQALHALEQIPYNTEKLEVFARYVIERNK